MYVLTTLGRVALSRVQQPTEGLVGQTRPLILLALLATSRRLSGQREHLAQLLWPNADLGRARRSLRQALFHLAKDAPELVQRDGDTLTLNRAVFDADFWRLEAALKNGQYAQAVELYRGSFLAGQERKVSPELEHWIESKNSQISSGIEFAYEKLIADAMHRGDTDAAVQYARALVELNPLDDNAQTQLVRVLRARGDEVAALGAFHAYRTLLEKSLGDAPDRDLERRMAAAREELFRDILPGNPADHGPGMSAAATTVSIPTARRTRVGLLSVAALVAVGIGVLASLNLSPRPAGTLANISGRLLIWTAQGTDTTSAELAIHGARVDRKTRRGVAPDEVPSPDGQWIALAQAASDGWNLAMRSATSDQSVTLTSTPQDEFPLTWSPDGRFLMFARRRVHRDGRRYVHDVRVFDVNRGISRSLAPDLTSIDRPSASWSPNGTQIAFTADEHARQDIYVVDFDGARLRNTTRNPARDALPAWSPDQERIAFVSKRREGTAVLTMRPDGTDLRTVTSLEADVGSLAWLTPTVLLFTTRSGGDGDVWAADAFGGATRRLTFEGDIVGLSVTPASEHVAWVDRVRMNPVRQLVSPGQFIAISVRADDQSGNEVNNVGVPVSWSIGARDNVRLLHDGLMQVTDTGLIEVVASLAGWQEDTMRILSVPAVEVARQPLMEETWTGGLDSARWARFGEPASTTRPSGAPRGGVLVNNGDAFFESGVILRTPVPLKDGVTVQTYGRIPFTGQLHQAFGIALRTGPPEDSLEFGGTNAVVDFRIRGPTADEPTQAWIATPSHWEDVPPPQDLRSWHEYTLQILPDGSVEILIDGMMHWRSELRVSQDQLQSGVGYLTLGFQSYQTEIEHGPVVVFAEPRYVRETVHCRVSNVEC